MEKGRGRREEGGEGRRREDEKGKGGDGKMRSYPYNKISERKGACTLTAVRGEKEKGYD